MPSDQGEARNPEHYAIVIGIDKYSQFRPLRAAVRDATRFAEWLESPEGGGLPKSNIHLITSPSEAGEPNTNPFSARPVRDDVDHALARIGVQSKRRIGSRLYFYFAGHGFGPTFDNIGMLMANAAIERLDSNVGLLPYRHFFRDWGFFDEVVFILDCCRDEFVSVNQTSRPGFTFGQIDGARPPVNDFIVMAAPHGAKAFQAQDTNTGERRGLLTEALLEALQSADAADPRGRFTASSLRAYVERRVPELADAAPIDPLTGKKLEQKPEITPPPSEIVFGAIPVNQLEQVRVRIVASAGSAGLLELRGNDWSVIASRPANDATADKPPWEEQLLRLKWYALTNTSSPPGTPPTLIDLREAKGDPHVITL
ncbi:MAG TPA: caspase family protein [Pyrinomonadaceae bacterium]|nr:caspase family protein [Pyrinomonadaceae bacterium]